ncbi:MAG: hypothetical protein ACI9ZH_002108, partial [Paracoccaceae bacterium]
MICVQRSDLQSQDLCGEFGACLTNSLKKVASTDVVYFRA